MEMKVTWAGLLVGLFRGVGGGERCGRIQEGRQHGDEHHQSRDNLMAESGTHHLLKQRVSKSPKVLNPPTWVVCTLCIISKYSYVGIECLHKVQCKYNLRIADIPYHLMAATDR